jgi:hypothetical protein
VVVLVCVCRVLGIRETLYDRESSERSWQPPVMAGGVGVYMFLRVGAERAGVSWMPWDLGAWARAGVQGWTKARALVDASLPRISRVCS